MVEPFDHVCVGVPEIYLYGGGGVDASGSNRQPHVLLLQTPLITTD